MVEEGNDEDLWVEVESASSGVVGYLPAIFPLVSFPDRLSSACIAFSITHGNTVW